MTRDPCLLHARLRPDELVSLEHPLLDRYVVFVASRCRPNTVRATVRDLRAFFAVIAKAGIEWGSTRGWSRRSSSSATRRCRAAGVRCADRFHSCAESLQRARRRDHASPEGALRGWDGAQVSGPRRAGGQGTETETRGTFASVRAQVDPVGWMHAKHARHSSTQVWARPDYSTRPLVRCVVGRVLRGHGGAPGACGVG